MIALRPYQDHAVAAAIDAIERKKNGILSMPTGSGKSLVIAGIAKALDANIVVLQPTKEILDQNYSKLYEFGHRDIAIYSASAGTKKRAQVTFATIGTIINNPDLFADTQAIVVDECHLVNAKAGQYKNFIERLGVPAIGLTATPYRMAVTFRGAVVEAKFLHRTKPRIFDHMGYVVQNNDLHRDGYLSKIIYYERDDYDPYAIALNSTGLNYNDAALAAYNRLTGLCKKAVDTIVGNYDACRHFLNFVSSIEESKEIEELLHKSGIAVAHVDGTTPKKERERILAEFKSGRLKVVTNVGVLTTGFDFPALDGIVLARPTMSLPLYYQMVGRGVRQIEGKEACRVFDLCRNVERFGQPDRYRIEAEEGEKYRLRSGDRYLTGVNFISGRDLEKQREKRAATQKAERSAAKTGDAVLPFGKHKGTKLSALPLGYLEWCAENFESGKWKEIFADELARRKTPAELPF